MAASASTLPSIECRFEVPGCGWPAAHATRSLKPLLRNRRQIQRVDRGIGGNPASARWIGTSRRMFGRERRLSEWLPKNPNPPAYPLCGTARAARTAEAAARTRTRRPGNCSGYAPTTVVFPLTDTDQPNASPCAPSEAANSCCCAHAAPLRTKYVRGALAAVFHIRSHPAVCPLSDTEYPKPSPGAPSAAVTSCCCVQTVPLRAKTYAAPCEAILEGRSDNGSISARRDGPAEEVVGRRIRGRQLLLLGPYSRCSARTRTQLPGRRSWSRRRPPPCPRSPTWTSPNSRNVPLSEAVSFCCWIHVPLLFTNTYAAPRAVFSKGAPITVVIPSSDTE